MLAALFGDFRIYRKLTGGTWYFVSLKEFPSIKLWVRYYTDVANLIKTEHY